MAAQGLTFGNSRPHLAGARGARIRVSAGKSGPSPLSFATPAGSKTQWAGAFWELPATQPLIQAVSKGTNLICRTLPDDDWSGPDLSSCRI